VRVVEWAIFLFSYRVLPVAEVASLGTGWGGGVLLGDIPPGIMKAGWCQWGDHFAWPGSRAQPLASTGNVERLRGMIKFDHLRIPVADLGRSVTGTFARSA